MGLSGLRGGRVEVAGKLAIDKPNGRSYALDMVAIELAQEEKLMALAHQIDVLQVQFAREASDYAASRQYEVDGFTTAIGWLRFNCHMSSNAAANSVCVGENLDRLSDSLEKVYSSELGYAHLVVLARTADDVGDAFNEHDLLPQALENSPGKLHFQCRHYRHAKHPAAVAAEEADLVEQRTLKFSSWPNGAIGLNGVLDPVGGAAVINALKPLARPLGRDDERTHQRRLADALVELASGGEVKVNLQVTATVETLASIGGAPCADIQHALPISSQSVEQLACDCSITRVLLGAESQVIDVGRAKRVPSAPVRRALNARDKGCRWPSCDRPGGWCASHHLVHWTQGGPTDLDNLVLLCHRHHTLVHKGGWQVVRAEDGGLLAIPPEVRFDSFAKGPD